MTRIESGARLSDAEITDISRANRWTDLTHSLDRVLSPFGICKFMQYINFTHPNGKIRSHLHGTLERSFDAPFRKSSGNRQDPISIHAIGTNVPVEWTTDHLSAKGCGNFYSELKSAGICSGISVCSRSLQAVSRIDFYRTAETSSPASVAEQADILMVATYAHKSAEQLLKQEARDNPEKKRKISTLSDREVECLGWSANGKTSAEIGMILGISQRTVYFHLHSVSSKLGVYGTRHAISKAVMMGIVAPLQNA